MPSVACHVENRNRGFSSSFIVSQFAKVSLILRRKKGDKYFIIRFMNHTLKVSSFVFFFFLEISILIIYLVNGLIIKLTI